MMPMRRLLRIGACISAVLLGGCARGAWPVPAGAAQMPPGPGTLLEQTEIPGPPGNATASRILYRSTGLKGEPITVSGLVVVPPGNPPPGGRPIVAWAHPTTGLVPRCAPSEAIFRFQQIQGLRDMVFEHGYVVVATDYPGLGTEGPHPYLVGTSEARAVLDSVRAARQIPAVAAERRFAVWGHSQGGQAALFTGIIAAQYAPELQLVGVAVAAPATELGPLFRADLDTPAGKNLAAMTLWSWAQVYGAPIAQVVSPAAVPAIDRLAQECIESPYDLFVRQRTEKPLQTNFLTVPDLTAVQPWAGLIAENTPGPLPPSIPLFIAQGTADKVVPPRITADYIRQLCAAGSAVTIDMLPGVGHGFAAMRGARDAVAWIADRFAGQRPPNDCR